MLKLSTVWVWPGTVRGRDQVTVTALLANSAFARTGVGMVPEEGWVVEPPPEPLSGRFMLCRTG